MWSLSLVLLFSLNAPQQDGPARDQAHTRKVAEIQMKLRRMVLQQNAPAVDQDFRKLTLPEIQIRRFAPKSSGQDSSPPETELRARKLLEEAAERMKSARSAWDANTCFAIRSYVFHREDGQAPKLVNTTVCTPGNTLRTLQVSPAPIQLVPAK